MKHFQSASLLMITILGTTFAAEAQAGRFAWENFEQARQHNSTYVQFIKRKTDWVEYQNNKLMFTFQETKRVFGYVELYDADRNISVALFNDRCMVWLHNSNPKWVTYYHGGWCSTRYHVTFQRMFVHDDKESGSGDWNVKATIPGTVNGGTLIGNKELSTGQAAVINHTFVVNRKSFDIFCQVREHDGGIGAKWEYVGEKRLRISCSGEYKMRISGSEGDVSLSIKVVAVD